MKGGGTRRGEKRGGEGRKKRRGERKGEKEGDGRGEEGKERLNFQILPPPAPTAFSGLCPLP